MRGRGSLPIRRGTFLYATGAATALHVAAPSVAFAQPAGLAPIRFISSLGDDLRPILYAQSTGMFRQAGLDFSMQIASGGAMTAQAVVGGTMDIGKATITAIIAAHARGVPVVLIAPSMMYRKESPTSGVVVAPNSPIRTPRDLQGKVVACAALGGIAYLGLRALVDGEGGDSALLRFVELPGSAVGIAVQQGRVDAGVTEEPFLTEETRTGKVRLLFDMLDGYGAPILESVFFTTRDFASKHADAVARFRRVVQDAARYTNTHEAETVPLFIELAKMDPRLATQMHHTFTPLSFNTAQIQPVIDMAAKYRAIPAAFDARDLLAP